MFDELWEPMLAGILVALVNRFVINNSSLWSSSCCKDTRSDDEQPVVTSSAVSSEGSDQSFTSAHGVHSLHGPLHL